MYGDAHTLGVTQIRYVDYNKHVFSYETVGHNIFIKDVFLENIIYLIQNRLINKVSGGSCLV